MYRKTKVSSRSGAWTTFKQLDLFGRHVQLTFKGQETFKNHFGAFLTVLLALGFLIYLAIKVNILVTHSQYTYNQVQ